MYRYMYVYTYTGKWYKETRKYELCHVHITKAYFINDWLSASGSKVRTIQ